jgi:hypothetical protein
MNIYSIFKSMFVKYVYYQLLYLTYLLKYFLIGHQVSNLINQDNLSKCLNILHKKK